MKKISTKLELVTAFIFRNMIVHGNESIKSKSAILKTKNVSGITIDSESLMYILSIGVIVHDEVNNTYYTPEHIKEYFKDGKPFPNNRQVIDELNKPDGLIINEDYISCGYRIDMWDLNNIFTGNLYILFKHKDNKNNPSISIPIHILTNIKE